MLFLSPALLPLYSDTSDADTAAWQTAQQLSAPKLGQRRFSPV